MEYKGRKFEWRRVERLNNWLWCYEVTDGKDRSLPFCVSSRISLKTNEPLYSHSLGARKEYETEFEAQQAAERCIRQKLRKGQ